MTSPWRLVGLILLGLMTYQLFWQSDRLASDKTRNDVLWLFAALGSLMLVMRFLKDTYAQ